MDEIARKSRKVSASTKWAVEYPAVFALMSGGGVAVGTAIATGDLRAVLSLTIATPILCWFIWRPKSPIARRVRERMKVEKDEAS